jgi:hypothetical protein
MIKEWSTFSSSDRTHCIAEATMGGSSSYTDLLTCLEMARVRPLKSETASSSAPTHAVPAPVGHRQPRCNSVCYKTYHRNRPVMSGRIAAQLRQAAGAFTEVVMRCEYSAYLKAESSCRLRESANRVTVNLRLWAPAAGTPGPYLYGKPSAKSWAALESKKNWPQLREVAGASKKGSPQTGAADRGHSGRPSWRSGDHISTVFESFKGISFMERISPRRFPPR